ncbi:cysteine hydrolase family protein [Faecalibaculum rodentium]|uniref:cysteine hydrolase family protein n=1 Tax=Faecalibaculum rodentium TaxID=1702221 RepID=UPI0026263BCA|nr:isochorismatase family cysteine hydrolase [Faecalibaculum rodentium]
MKIQVADLKQPVLFVVDMINGFAKQGALADPAISDAAPNIRRLIQSLNAPAWFVADEHDWNAREFDAFPPHCLKNTEESDIIDELADCVEHRIPKNSTNTFFAPDFQMFLQEQGSQYHDWVITGCCTDICVLQFALALKAFFNQTEQDRRVIVPADCTATYHMDEIHDGPFWQKTALDLMKAAGVLVVDAIVDTDPEKIPAAGSQESKKNSETEDTGEGN